MPSGTGMSAFYLSKYLKVPVLTTPCIGDEIYLKNQWEELGIENKTPPRIINTQNKYHFAKCYKEFISIYKELKKYIEFDLLYDPKGFISIKQNPQDGFNIIYIHGGGISGNASMLNRYKNIGSHNTKL
jgi:1-aminocyclopropane-1-carboxylate deaminase/D-cysteine desulfhydrase-like pyridoxal-dependent ACC family enzyme